MPGGDASDLTRQLEALDGVIGGDGRQAAAELFPHVYEELRAMAGRAIRHGGPRPTLQPTLLVHEAWIKLSRGEDGVSIKSRAHFFALASTAIRQILIEHARKRASQKRGGARRRVTLHEAVTPGGGASEYDILALEEAMTRLAAVDERAARVVQLKFFGGLSTDEIAVVLSVSSSTVEDDWRVARAWLKRELSRSHPA
jgi:RNA polymerase sigma factor (TIGR02999 family)